MGKLLESVYACLHVIPIQVRNVIVMYFITLLPDDSVLQSNLGELLLIEDIPHLFMHRVLEYCMCRSLLVFII